MTIKHALHTIEVLGGSGHNINGQRFAFLDFAQSKLGSDPLSIAVPSSEMHKLVSIAMQAVPIEQRHQLLASLVPSLKTPPVKDGETHFVQAFGVSGWEVGSAEDGAVVVTLYLEPNTGSLSFRFENRKVLQLAGMLRTAANAEALQSYSGSQVPSHPFLAIAEDIEWLRDEWATGYRRPSAAELRRGSGTLRQLLLNGALGHAWRHCGFKGSPRILAPNLLELLKELKQDPQHAVATFAGGIEIDGVSVACITLRKTLNRATGVGPEADEGFAVEVGSLAKRVVEGVEGTDDAKFADVRYTWKSVERYMAAASAIRRGTTISRKSVLDYFVKYSGGVHLDRTKNDPEKAALYALHEELEGRADIAGVDGLHAELLAMGQAVGRSPDTLHLAKAIREAAERNALPFVGVGLGISIQPS